MIVSVTCRHGTQSKIRRSEVGRELIALSKFMPGITRAQAVFSKETHHKDADDLVTCHLTIHIPNRRQIDIYESKPTETQAFDRARERAIQRLARGQSARSQSRQSGHVH